MIVSHLLPGPAALALACLTFVPHAGTAMAQSSPPMETTTPAPPSRDRQDADDPVPARLQLRAEFRERVEAIDGITFTGGQDDMFWLSRLRLTASVTATEWMTLHAQVQDARVAGKQVGTGGVPFSAPADVRIAHVALGRATSPVGLTLGRQELAFGEQRLVGHVSWANAARTFDSARLTLRRDDLRLDLFAGSVVRIRTADWDRSGFGNRFHGMYVSATRLIPRAVVEPYFFWRADRDLRTEGRAPGDLALGTTGLRLAGQLPGEFDYGIETVMQRGSLGSDTHRATAQHLRLRTPPLGTARLVGEYNYASGDDTVGDGRRGTFDPLYPTPHDKYGLSDQVGWRNVHHVRAAVELTTVPHTPITAAWHSWWLASATDALYSASGAAVARIPDGAPGRHVGIGVDVQASRALTREVTVAGGYAHIQPGTFLTAATPGDARHAVYLMLTLAMSAGQ